MYLPGGCVHDVRTLCIDGLEGLPHNLVQDIDDGEYHAGGAERTEPDIQLLLKDRKHAHGKYERAENDQYLDNDHADTQYDDLYDSCQ